MCRCSTWRCPCQALCANKAKLHTLTMQLPAAAKPAAIKQLLSLRSWLTGQHSTVQEEPAVLGTPEQCRTACHSAPGLAEAKLQHLRDVLPLVSLDLPSHELLRRRRCRACRAVSDAMVRMHAGGPVFTRCSKCMAGMTGTLALPLPSCGNLGRTGC